MNKDVIFSHNSDEWSTPQNIYMELDAEFHFDLDPCATSENHKCDNYYDKESNGLNQDWGGVEYFVIRRIPKLVNGLRNAIVNRVAIIQLLYC